MPPAQKLNWHSENWKSTIDTQDPRPAHRFYFTLTEAAGHPTCYLEPLTFDLEDISIKIWRCSGVWLLHVAVMLMVGCVQQTGSLSPSDNAASVPPLPFDRTPDNAGPPATADLAHPAIPAGTAIVIRLESPIASDNAHVGDSFLGTLEEPVVFATRTVLPTGSVVRGRILAAKPAESEEAGYLRLTLSSVLLGNKTLDVHTSSLFAKGSLPDGVKARAQNRSHPILEDVTSPANLEVGSHAQRDVKFSTARRLTFRLLKPLPLPN